MYRKVNSKVNKVSLSDIYAFLAFFDLFYKK